MEKYVSGTLLLRLYIAHNYVTLLRVDHTH